MPSGYEQSPDYGGKPPGSWDFAVFLIVVFVVAPLAWWYFTQDTQANCRVITPAETETFVEDGKRKGVLDLQKLNLKPGECLTLKP
ncbi:MAG: hypothetical protein HOP09_04795 [Hyphomicrobium sp.]|nr:hypothetical protein [Hyphomicrobium sp.]